MGTSGGDRPASPTACLAPSTALYLRPDGYVAACCGIANVLGRVTGPERRSLREIWDGAAAERLRDALAASDYGLGCWECRSGVEAGRRSRSLAASFDRYAASTGDYPALIDFAMSNRCNLACVMCNGGLSSTIRRTRDGRPPLAPAYDDRFFDELGEFLPHLERALFKGGEPFLARENHRVWDDLTRLGVGCEVSVTTNGTVWGRDVERYLEELAMDVIVSVDAVDDEVLRAIRVGVDPDRLWSNVDRFIEVTQRTGATVELCMCLMAGNWSELPGFLTVADRLGTRAKIIWVDGPRRFDLARLPLPERRSALDALRRRDDEMRSLGPEAAREWAAVLDRLEQTTSERSTAVTISSPGASLPGPVALPDQPFELVFHHEVVRRVNAPDWAAWLRPDSWIGIGLEQVMTHFATTTGGTLRIDMTTNDNGAHVANLTFEDDGREPTRLLAVLQPADDDSDPESRLVVTRADSHALP